MQSLIFPFYVVIIEGDLYYWKKPRVVNQQQALNVVVWTYVKVCVAVAY